MADDPLIAVKMTGDEVAVLFTIPERPWTTNAERRGNRYGRAANTKRWREMFAILASTVKLPTITDAIVEVELVLKGPLQDTAACNPAVKAAIDGMVDAKLLPNDTGEHIKAITFYAPERGKTTAVYITVKGKKYARQAT